METLWLEETDSTNNYLKDNWGSVKPMTLVVAVNQTAGRGQRGNSWESEPGKNLTFSFYFSPEGVRPAEQFVVSEAVSLAMVRTLEEYGISAEVKWPNDIYVGDRKICGILIENSIFGDSISRCFVGIGLNVNQEKFVSDAPNPVSMTMLTGKRYCLEEVLACFGRKMERYMACLADRLALHREYKTMLWRRAGAHPFRDNSNGEIFSAFIEDIKLSGHLVLRDNYTNGLRTYAFKEVAFIT